MVWGMDGIGSGPEDFGIFGMLEKAFSSEQCKEIEENNRMGKTRDCFKKIRDLKGIIHAKMHN